MQEEARVEKALTELVEAVRADLQTPAITLVAIADSLEALGDHTGPPDQNVARAARGTATALRNHAEDLRKAATSFSAKFGNPVPPLALVKESA